MAGKIISLGSALNIRKISKKFQREKGGKNYLPWISIEHEENIAEIPKGKMAGKVTNRLQRKRPRSSEWTKMAGNYLP